MKSVNSDGRWVLLVTGFGPFPGVRSNPSARLAGLVAGSPRWRLQGVEARSLVLPTTYAALESKLEPALHRAPRPRAVLMIGIATRSRRVRIERRATGRQSPLLPDAAGHAGGSQKGPARFIRRSSVSPAIVAAVLRRHGVWCRVSHDAGRYLCNAAFHRALVRVDPVLFLHVPRAPLPGRRRVRSDEPRPLDWHQRLARAFLAVGFMLLRPPLSGARHSGAAVAEPAPGDYTARERARLGDA